MKWEWIAQTGWIMRMKVQWQWQGQRAVQWQSLAPPFFEVVFINVDVGEDKRRPKGWRC